MKITSLGVKGLTTCPFFFNVHADEKEEPRILGLAMVPGKHIVSIEVDVE